MIAALRGAVFEGLKREETKLKMFERLSGEIKDQCMKDFLNFMSEETKKNIYMLKHLNLHMIMKFGIKLKFKSEKIELDENIACKITDMAAAKDMLKIVLDQLNSNIEYYENIADHSVFPESKRLFRIIADKELEEKSRVKALQDLLG